jgi:hypothetical protein
MDAEICRWSEPRERPSRRIRRLGDGGELAISGGARVCQAMIPARAGAEWLYAFRRNWLFEPPRGGTRITA